MAEAYWEYFAHSSRFKTKRRKKQLLKENREKQLIGLHRERNKLGKDLANLGLEELKPPVQKGWKRSFELADPAGLNSIFLIDLLTRINTIQYSYRNDFKIKRKKNGRKIWVDLSQDLLRRDFTPAEIPEKHWPLFREEWRWSSQRGRFKTLVFGETGLFVLKVQPNMVTHRKLSDPDIVSRLQEIENYLYGRRLQPILNRILDGYYWYPAKFKTGHPEKYKIKQKMMDLEIREHLSTLIKINE